MIQRALDALMRGRTVSAIAHRLSTVASFDPLVVLQDGQTVEDGTPNALVQHKGIYRDLVRHEVSRLSAQAA